MPETIKALSLWQPWASLCCIGHPDDPARSVKGFETRSWGTRYRGPLLIHAAQRFTYAERGACFSPLINGALRRHYHVAGVFSPDDLPRGAIVGRVELVECHPAMAAASEADEHALAMGHYEPGRFAWEIVRPVLFPEPIAFRGRQGLFNVPLTALPEEARP